MVLEPGEDVVSNSCALAGRRCCDRVLFERVPDLVERGRYREPDEQCDRSSDDGEVEKDGGGLGDAMPAEPFDAGPDRGRERDREEEEDEDAPDLPDTEGERRDCERGGGRLRHAKD